MRRGRLLPLVVLALLGADAGEEPVEGFEQTPPRLALVEGEASFQRPGSEDWVPARPNLALAPGDRLYTREGARLELQIGPRDFLRVGERTELALVSDGEERLQLGVGAGLVSLDVRSPGRSIELDTPNAAFAIEEPGNYRLEVASDATTLACRRGGRATLTTPNGGARVVDANEQVVVTGQEEPHVETSAAPQLDGWDVWNDQRTDRALDSLSVRYVSSDVYGASDLDASGSWHTVETYGPIWVPVAVPVGWAPYAFGRWLWDPRFGWTWLDDAAWGWAPFHYGRWVQLHGVWVWVPGPLGVRPYYAPALVAFYGGPRTVVGWVPLGWGEPCRPWWGPHRYVGQPHWLGWGGPRIVSESHANAALAGGPIAVPGTAFGREPVATARLRGIDTTRLRLVRGALLVEPTPVSHLGASEPIGAPPRALLDRPVVSTRGRPDVLRQSPFGNTDWLERRSFDPSPRFGIESLRPNPTLPRAGPPARPGKGKAGDLAPAPGVRLPGLPAKQSQPGSPARPTLPHPAVPALGPVR